MSEEESLSVSRSNTRSAVAMTQGSISAVVASSAQMPCSVSALDRSRPGKSRTGWPVAAVSAVATAL